MDRKRRKLTPGKVIAELEQVKELGRSELESEMGKYKEQCTELQSENEKLQSENEKFQSENEKFQSENEKLQSENEKLQSENEKLQSENEKLQSENKKLQSENKKLQKYLQDLESVNVREKSPTNLSHSDITSQITKIMNNRYSEIPGMNPPPGIPRDYPCGPTPMPTSNPLYPSGVGFAPNMSASPYPSTAFTSGNPSNSSYPAASSSYLLAPASFSNRYPASTSLCPASSNSLYPASTSSFPISPNSCYPTSCNSTRPAQTLAYPYRSNRHYPASVSSYPVPPLMNEHPGAFPYPLMGSRGYESTFGSSVNKSSNDALDINSLPDEILVKVFGYLKQNKLGQIARVCSRWNALTKSGVLWRKVNVEITFRSDRSENSIVKSFINRLPSCVTFIRVFFYKWGKWIAPLDFEELCPRLQEKCPHLEELILNTAQLSNSLSTVMDLCTKYLQSVKNLIFQYVEFRLARPTGECFGISKIEKLELYDCSFDYSNKPPFTKMPYLKHLNVCGDDVGDSWIADDGSFLNQLDVLHLTCSEINSRTFLTIQDKGLNLRELYFCGLHLEDLQGHDLTFTNSAFPHLETICISHTGVTCESVVSLIQSHPSLQNVYVDENVTESFAAHPFVLANRCKAGIVKAIVWGHSHYVDYLPHRF